jgi:hypothetical protein
MNASSEINSCFQAFQRKGLIGGHFSLDEMLGENLSDNAIAEWDRFYARYFTHPDIFGTDADENINISGVDDEIVHCLVLWGEKFNNHVVTDLNQILKNIKGNIASAMSDNENIKNAEFIASLPRRTVANADFKFKWLPALASERYSDLEMDNTRIFILVEYMNLQLSYVDNDTMKYAEFNECSDQLFDIFINEQNSAHWYNYFSKQRINVRPWYLMTRVYDMVFGKMIRNPIKTGISGIAGGAAGGAAVWKFLTLKQLFNNEIHRQVIVYADAIATALQHTDPVSAAAVMGNSFLEFARRLPKKVANPGIAQNILNSTSDYLLNNVVSKNAKTFLDAADGLLNLNPTHQIIQDQVDAAVIEAMRHQKDNLAFLTDPSQFVTTYIKNVKAAAPLLTVQNIAVAGSVAAVAWVVLETTDYMLQNRYEHGVMNKFVAAIPQPQPMDIEEGGDASALPPPQNIEEVQERIFDHLQGPLVGQKRLQYPLESMRALKRMRPDSSAIFWF